MPLQQQQKLWETIHRHQSLIKSILTYIESIVRTSQPRTKRDSEKQIWTSGNAKVILCSHRTGAWTRADYPTQSNKKMCVIMHKLNFPNKNGKCKHSCCERVNLYQSIYSRFRNPNTIKCNIYRCDCEHARRVWKEEKKTSKTEAPSGAICVYSVKHMYNMMYDVIYKC